MSNQLQVIENASNHLSNSWGVDEVKDIALDKEEKAYEAFLAKIEWVVKYLLEKDFERLLWMLYKVDVSEAKVSAIMDGREAGDVAKLIAQMIIEREIQKAQTRIAYKKERSAKDDLDPDRW